MIVNVMTPAARDFYDLEGLWRHGERIPMDHILQPGAAATAAEPEPEPGVGGDEGWGSFDPFSKVGILANRLAATGTLACAARCARPRSPPPRVRRRFSPPRAAPFPLPPPLPVCAPHTALGMAEWPSPAYDPAQEGGGGRGVGASPQPDHPSCARAGTPYPLSSGPALPVPPPLPPVPRRPHA